MYDVRKTTFEIRIDSGNLNAIDNIQVSGRSIDLQNKMEDESAKQVLLSEERFFDLTRNDMRHLAFQWRKVTIILVVLI
jgi:hypothetical protein